MSEVIISYKGFNKDMTCKGKQYEEGKEYIENTQRRATAECTPANTHLIVFVIMAQMNLYIM